MMISPLVTRVYPGGKKHPFLLAHSQSAASMTEPVEKVTGVTVDGVVAVQVYTCPSVV